MKRQFDFFITGGTGFLGRNLIQKYYNDNEITVYSRDEAKQYYLKKEYPKTNFKESEGLKIKSDIKINSSHLTLASTNVGCNPNA